MPHTLVPTAGIFFQVAEVHGFDEDPRWFASAAYRLPQIQRYSKVHYNVITILRFVYQRMYCSRLVLEEL